MFKEMLSSVEFANASTFLSAIGSLGAVIVSLWLAKRSSKAKVNIHSNNMVITGVPEIEGYMIFVTNKSPNLNIKIASPLFVKINKRIFTKRQKWITFTSNKQLDMTFALPKTLKYGEEHIFCLLGTQIEAILKDCSEKKITFRIFDTVGNKFCHKVDRKKLEEALKEIGKK